jgi:hypothetical protein
MHHVHQRFILVAKARKRPQHLQQPRQQPRWWVRVSAGRWLDQRVMQAGLMLA